jgi:exopolysaccharide production protein ExoZ
MSPNSVPPRSAVLSVQALRGISALLVVGFHYLGALDNVYVQRDLGTLMFGGGWVGLDLFFLISGFVMVFITEQRREARFFPFLIKRFVRIIPITWLATVGYFFAKGGHWAELPAARQVWADLLFTKSYLVVTWTIVYELVFYAVFATAFSISHRYRSLVASLLIALAVFAAQRLAGPNFSFQPDEADSNLKHGLGYGTPVPLLVLCNPLSLEFIPGMLLGELYLWLSRTRWRLASVANLLLPFAILLFSAAYFGRFYTPWPPERLLYALPYCVALFAALLLAESNGELHVPRVLIRLGELTLSIYLLHIPVSTLLTRMPYFEQYTGLPAVLLWTSATVLLSLVSYFFAERPSIALGRALVRALEQKTPRLASLPSWGEPKLPHARKLGTLGLVGLCACGALCSSYVPAGISAKASATFENARAGGSAAIDGDRTTCWGAPSKLDTWLDVHVNPPRAIEKLKLLNMHNPPWHDRGTKDYALLFYLDGKLLRRIEGTMAWSDQPDWVVHDVALARVDRIRFTAKNFHRFGPGLCELVME